MAGGWFGIGIENSKTPMNIGTLWRSAYVLDASLLFTINRRYERQASDNVGAANHLPLIEYNTVRDFARCAPTGAKIIGVEFDPKAIPLRRYQHPDKAIYLLGAEDLGLTPEARHVCDELIYLPGKMSVNVSVAGSVVMFHRIMQREREAALLRLAPAKVLEQLKETKTDHPIGPTWEQLQKDHGEQ